MNTSVSHQRSQRRTCIIHPQPYITYYSFKMNNISKLTQSYWLFVVLVSRLTRSMEFLLLVIIAAQLQFVTGGTSREALVFEAFSDGDEKSYDLYMGTGISTQGLGNKVHFKDPLVNMWGNQMFVHKVTLAIVKNLEVKAFVVFNGTGTDKTSWMTQNRILNSSYTDIRAKSANFFSVDGHVLPHGKGRRAFYINKSFNGCGKDVGWIQLIAGTGYCTWESSSISKTLVLFIPQSEAGVWQNKSQTADSMRIYIKYEEIPGSSTTSTSSSSSDRMTTEVLSTTNVDVSTEKTAAATTLVKGTNCPHCVPCASFQLEKNMTLNELKQEVEKLKSQLRVDKTKLSSSIRRRTSAVDKRPSASAVGGVIGGVVMAAVFGAIVVPDMFTLCRYLYAKLKRK